MDHQPLLIGISADSPHAGKSTFASLLSSIYLERTGHPLPINETSDEARILFDKEHGTRTAESEEHKRLHRRDLGNYIRRRSEEEPGFLVPPLVSLGLPRIIGGLRGEDELLRMREAGGVLIRITTSEVTRRARMTEDEYEKFLHSPREHELSEYSGWDFIVPNDGTQDEFEKRAIEIMDRLLQ
jgi:hypothetical protein